MSREEVFRIGDVVCDTETMCIGQIVKIKSECYVVKTNKLKGTQAWDKSNTIRFNKRLIDEYYENGAYRKVKQVLALIDLNKPTQLRYIGDARVHEVSFELDENGNETDDIKSYGDDISSGFAELVESPLGKFNEVDNDGFVDMEAELWYRVKSLDILKALFPHHLMREIKLIEGTIREGEFSEPLLEIEKAIDAFESGREIFYRICPIY